MSLRVGGWQRHRVYHSSQHIGFGKGNQTHRNRAFYATHRR
jgi:hypothetical protein